MRSPSAFLFFSFFLFPLFSLGTSGALGAQTKVYKCPCLDSVCVDMTRGGVWRDNRVRAYTGSGSSPLDIHGLLKFDFSKVPDTSKILAVRMVLTLEHKYGSPKSNPVVDVFWSADDKWTRSNASRTSGKPAAKVGWHVIDFTGNTHVFPMDLAAHDFSGDLKDDRVTLGIDNVNPAYSYVYFYGPAGNPAGPAPYLEVVTGAGPVLQRTIGTGCKDSLGKAVAMTVSKECVCLGSPVPLQVRVSGTLKATALPAAGKSPSNWGPITLPFALAPFGAPGCSLWASMELLFPPFQMPPGGAAFEPVVPNTPVLKGVPVFFQSLVIDPKANALGMATTNAVQVILW